jgi:hypothetical protein
VASSFHCLVVAASSAIVNDMSLTIAESIEDFIKS